MTDPASTPEKQAAMQKPDNESPEVNEKDIIAGHVDYHGIDTRGIVHGVDEVYEREVSILNAALIDLGMRPFQWRIFALTGLGWFIDNFWMQAITIISAPVQVEFSVDRIAFLTVAKYAGLVVGSTVWPMTADFIGRRLAFNITLLLSSVAGLIGAGSPNFVAISPVDSAIFLKYIPATHQYLLNMQSAFWSIGQAVAALIGWPLIANYSCPSDTPARQCTFQDNLGWRYSYWTFGGLTLVMFLARLLFKLYKTPKYLLGKGLDQQAVNVVNKVAARNKTTTWLTISHFEAIDAELAHQRASSPSSPAVPPNKSAPSSPLPELALSTTLMLFLWCSIGMAYPLYNSFIPIYLATKGVSYGSTSLSETYRTYAIQAVCGIPASLLGGLLVNTKHLGRKGTGTLVCFCTGIFLFLFLFTRATTNASVLGFTCAIAFFQNLVYGLLYSYTPELFFAPVRETANGLVALGNRLSGLMAPIIAAYVGVETDVPVWISASLFVVAGLVFLVLPYETRGRAAS
ncbi:major facilitator superfamily domain-containing protein [Aspergillus keveii]|uniref:Major facilitator superfamily domain-containing protein n=1 Tax=Aspergillus keveii TaxID=714993 RepID=A0ABR4FK30_9EURO